MASTESEPIPNVYSELKKKGYKIYKKYNAVIMHAHIIRCAQTSFYHHEILLLLLMLLQFQAAC